MALWKHEKEIAKHKGEAVTEKDTLIEDQFKRGLLTREEADEAKYNGMIKIGSKIIEYGEGSERISEDIFVKLYSDGTLVFSGTDTTVSDKEMVENYGNIKGQVYEYKSGAATTPWYEKRELIKKVEVIDKLQTTNMNYWFSNCKNLESADLSNIKCLRYHLSYVFLLRKVNKCRCK